MNSPNINPREFGPAPFWAWLGAMTPGSIDRNLRRFQAMDIHALVVMPLYGLVPEYLGPEYFELFRHACRRCRAWGMKIWIYDEFNWPSGTCAGRVLLQHPWARQQIMQIDRRVRPGAGRVRHGWRIRTYENFQLAAYGAAWARPASGYLDTLNPRAVRAYIEMTHAAYQREVGGFFGDVIAGFFTDEPVVNRTTDAFPYTPGLFDRFQDRYGYDLRPLVPALVAPHAAAWRVRRDYWSLVTDLFRESFFQPYADWCAAHGLEMTGHLLNEETLDGNLIRNGDVFDMLAVMQTPGIDVLYGATSRDVAGPMPVADSIKRDLTGKLIDSVARFAGKQRTLCEAFGCMPNSATMRDYKRAVDFLFHHGLSLINDNLFADSLGSFRKFCGGHAFLTPWTRHYNLLARHVAAMSQLNAGAALAAETALYYPGTDARARYTPPRFMDMGVQFMPHDWQCTQQTIHQLAHGLPRRHWSYLLMFDQVLRTARITRGGMQCGTFRCRALILPDIHFIGTDIAAILQRFAAAGGMLICAGRRPAVLDPMGRVRPWRITAPARVVDVRAGADELVDRVVAVLRARLKPACAVSGIGADDVMVTRRQADAGEFLMLTNFGAHTAEITAQVDGAWRQWDTVSGQPGARLSRVEALRPDETRVFLRTNAQSARLAAPARRRPGMRLSAAWELRLPGGNTIALPMAVYRGVATNAMPAAAPARQWTTPEPESSALALTPGRTYWLRREFDLECRPRKLHLLTDGCDACEVFVNRRRIRPGAGLPPVWDDDNQVCDIRRAVRRGRNELLVRYTPAPVRKHVTRMVPPTDLPPFVLRGDFLALSWPDRQGVIPALGALPGYVETGPLDAQGYPHLAGVAEYAQTVRLADSDRQAVLDLGRQTDLFEVEINGRPAGTAGWAPYQVPVGAWLKRGDNRIVLRLRTALGGVVIRYFKGLEKKRPPTGLLEAPVLYGCRGEQVHSC